MKWEDKTSVQKGALAEAVVDQFLIDNGWIPYVPMGGPHPFDRLSANMKKRKIMVIEVKAKAARTHYPDTGVNVKHYEGYKRVWLYNRLPVFLAFVDEVEGAIYGEFLGILEKERTVNGNVYPLVQKGIRYWPRSAMRTIAMLNDLQVENLKALSNRNPAYEDPQCN